MPEGDFLIMSNHLRTIYDAIPQEHTNDEPPQMIRGYRFPDEPPPPIDDDLLEVHSSEGLFNETEWLRNVHHPLTKSFILYIYNFATDPTSTWKEFDTNILPLFAIQTDDLPHNNHRKSEIMRRITTTYYVFWGVLEKLSEEWFENVLEKSKIGPKCSIFIKLAWKVRISNCLKKCVAKNGSFNVDTHFNKYLFSTANCTNESYHKLKVTINSLAEVFTGQENQEELTTLTLHTKYIRFGGRNMSLEKLYTYVAFKALLSTGATYDMIRCLKNYDICHSLRPLELSVSGITARTRNYIRQYTCDFATVMYESKLNNGNVNELL